MTRLAEMKIEKEEYLNGLVNRVNEFVAEKDKYISQLKEENDEVVFKLKVEIDSLKDELAEQASNTTGEQNQGTNIDRLRIEPTIIEETSTDDIDNIEMMMANQKNTFKQISYGHDLTDHPEYENIRFSINSNGFTIIAYNNYVELCARILLYSPKGDLIKKTDFDFLAMVGLSIDTVYTARCAKNRIEIQSYGLNMHKKQAYIENTETILGYYSIDTSNSFVYFKVQTKASLLRTDDYTYMIYVFDKNLKKIDSFSFDDANDLYDLKIRNDILSYFSWKENQFAFSIKSIKSKEVMHKFDLTFDSLFGYDIGPNGNLFILVKKQNILNEYDISGKFIKTTKLDVSTTQNVSEMFITDNFDFAINDKHTKNIYYIINGLVPKKRSIKTFVKKHIFKMRVSNA